MARQTSPHALPPESPAAGRDETVHNSATKPQIAEVALPTPVYRCFDYRIPPGQAGPAVGARVRVPFGRRQAVGVVVALVPRPRVEASRLRELEQVLDDEPLLPAPLLELIHWASRYYHHPLGECLAAALPAPLRRGEPARPVASCAWQVSAAGAAQPAHELRRRAPAQAQLLARLQQAPAPLAAGAFAGTPGDWRGALERLTARGLAQAVELPSHPLLQGRAGPAPNLNDAQQQAVAAVREALGRFQALLLDGVTGSGKTEVYLQAVAAVLARGGQALLLVPEIGLTPQLLERFTGRLAARLAVLHSGLADGERLGAWLAARSGAADVVIGTRSALFTPLPRLALVVVDEEHDPSLKQQDGFRYSARDLAVARARAAGVPVLLGSATPALESLHNSSAGRYRQLSLPRRAGAARAPQVRLVDLRGRPLQHGLSSALSARMEQHLAAGGQVLLFLNRRGYAPVVLCHECGWQARCRRCDAHMTLHRGRRTLLCHHCGARQSIPERCPECAAVDLRPVGEGTERLEQGVRERFPDVPVARIDRDSLTRRGALEQALAAARSGERRILLGTQLLAKGHHLPEVTLVGIVDADGGLFSADFRATERLAQTIVQVAGRAGRAERPGEVLIQTHHPEHPLLQVLLQEGYPGFAREALAARQAAGLPPFAAMALLRAEAIDPQASTSFLQQALDQAAPLARDGVAVHGPLPAPMERRAGRTRAQLVVLAPRRGPLQRLLGAWIPQLQALPGARRVRWSVDVDPVDTF